MYEPPNLKREKYPSSDVRNQLAESWDENRVLQSLIEAERPRVVDVGAYTGNSASRFRKLFLACSLLCFEPNPEAFAELRRTSEMLGGNIEIVNAAVSDVDGEVDFHIQGIDPALSGLQPRNLASQDSIDLVRVRQERSEYLKKVNSDRIKVQSVRLDTHLRLDHAPIDLLKIDVQGSESKVLAGATHTLERVQALLVEVSIYDFYEGQSSFASIEKFTEAAGLRLWAITKNSRNPMNGRTDWVNAVYRRV